MRRISLLFFIFFIIFIPFSHAAKVNWTWIDSDNYSSRFIDMDSITSTEMPSAYVYNARPYVGTADIWVKLTYNSEGGLQELNSYGLSVPDSASVYSIIRLHCDLDNHTIQLVEGHIYNLNGKSIYDYFPQTYIPEMSRYQGVYYYVLSQLNHTDDFKQYKSWIIPIDYYHDDNGKVHNVVINKMTIKKNINHIYYSIYFVGLAPDNSISDILINNNDLNIENSTITTISNSVYKKNNGWIEINNYVNRQSLIYPGSNGAMLRDKLMKYCAENKAWIHRYDSNISGT
ncbi:hypothetical protein [Pectinatus haikarae]|uniref:hypothetical protein n=1 Tax=Pectinatus haikarae TaxID=349096 RepID=UPI0018C48982|nr:hypothetical protein [Pectinatus haikarae]